MRGAHAGVNDGDDDVVGRILDIPRVLRTDVRAGCAAESTGVVQSPKRTIIVTEIIWRQQGLDLVIRLGIFDQAATLVNGDKI